MRHTTPAVKAGVCYGQSDVGLAPDYMAEFATIRAKFVGSMFDACYTSPLQRCMHLATALGYGEPRSDRRLMELHFGTWEMRPWRDIPRAELDVWAEAYVDRAPSGGETFGALQRRVTDFLQMLHASHVGQSLLVVTHAGVIRALLADALQMPLTETFDFQLTYGGVTRLVYAADGCRVDCLNR